MGCYSEMPSEPSSKTQIFVINTQPKEIKSNELPARTKYGTKTTSNTRIQGILKNSYFINNSNLNFNQDIACARIICSSFSRLARVFTKKMMQQNNK
jgi:hypothetical protein